MYPNNVEYHERCISSDAGQATGITTETSKQIHDGQKGNVRMNNVIQPATKVNGYKTNLIGKQTVNLPGKDCVKGGGKDEFTVP